MKKLLPLVFAMTLLPKGYAQDLLVTAKGDTLRCKILAQTDRQIFISAVQPDGTKISSYVSTDTIRTITPGYFDTRSVSAEELPANPSAVRPAASTALRQKPKHNRSPHPVRFALSGGYSTRLGKLDPDAARYVDESAYKNGFVVGADIAGFFNEHIGLGGFLNYRQYNKGDVSSIVVGPKLLTRFYNRSQRSAFILGLGLGYMSYKETVQKKAECTGGAFGGTIEAGYEIGLSKGVALMVNIAVTGGSLGHVKYGGRRYDLEKRENAGSLNLTAGIVFGR